MAITLSPDVTKQLLASIKRYVAENLDQIPLPDTGPVPPPPEHTNLRGPGYYTDSQHSHLHGRLDLNAAGDERGA